MIFLEASATGNAGGQVVRALAEDGHARYVEAFSSFYLDGTLDESPVLPTVRELLGREPRDFRTRVAEHVTAFDCGTA